MNLSSVKSAFRALRKSKSFGILNVVGLAIGIVSAGAILLWVEDEVTFNKGFAKYDRICQVVENQVYNGALSTVRVTPGPLSEALRTEVPGIANSAKTSGTRQAMFSINDKSTYHDGSYVEPGFLSIFTLDFLKGDPAHAFDQLHSLVITDKMATTFFGNSDPIGQTLKMNNDKLFTITGVVRPLPLNSFVRFDWLAPFDLIKNDAPWMSQWEANGFLTYVELEAGADRAALDNTLHGFLKTKKSTLDIQLFLFPMEQWHLDNHFTNGQVDELGQIRYVRLFTIIAVLIIMIACVNFMNLATARSEQRAKEVGVRKTLGAGRSKLVGQFLMEALMMSGAAVILATGILFFILPYFNTWVDKDLQLNLLDPLHIGGLVSIALLTGLLAGSYPAFFLSSFNPALVLKGWKMQARGGAVIVRQGLVTAQFIISITLIICTVVIYQQIQHTKQRDLGYAKDELVYMPVRGKLQEHFRSLKTALINTGYVENATMSVSAIFEAGWFSGDNYTWPGKDPDKDVMIMMEGATPEYVSTMGLKLVEGRDFYPDASNDNNNVIINRALANQLGDGNVLGTVITQLSSSDSPWRLTVIGVVEDFMYGDMYSSAAMPTMITVNSTHYNNLTMRFGSDVDVAKAVAAVEGVVRSVNPEYPFEYTFVDSQFDQLFKNETLFEKLAGAFAILAIFISCLGLYGLAAYTASRRAKEISIRKVLGATVPGLAGLLSKDFLKLVLLACIISFPAAWYVMKEWLSNYEYRTPIYWWVFLSTGAIALTIALLTVSFQTVRASVANPARNLKE